MAMKRFGLHSLVLCCLSNTHCSVRLERNVNAVNKGNLREFGRLVFPVKPTFI